MLLNTQRKNSLFIAVSVFEIGYRKLPLNMIYCNNVAMFNWFSDVIFVYR